MLASQRALTTPGPDPRERVGAGRRPAHDHEADAASAAAGGEGPLGRLAASAADVTCAVDRLVAAQAVRLALGAEDVARRCTLDAAVLHGVVLLAGAGLLVLALGLGQLLAGAWAWPAGAAWLTAGAVLLALTALLASVGQRLLRRKHERDATRRLARLATAQLAHELEEAHAQLRSALGQLARGLAQAGDPRPWVRRHPLASVGAAAAAGLAGGLLAATPRARSREPGSAAADATRAPDDAPPAAGAAAWLPLLVPLLDAWLASRPRRTDGRD